MIAPQNWMAGYVPKKMPKICADSCLMSEA
jgi:hypothetical protein